jgi:hypothetical protein
MAPGIKNEASDSPQASSTQSRGFLPHFGLEARSRAALASRRDQGGLGGQLFGVGGFGHGDVPQCLTSSVGRGLELDLAADGRGLCGLS